MFLEGDLEWDGGRGFGNKKVVKNIWQRKSCQKYLATKKLSKIFGNEKVVSYLWQ
jgi:hypothetical protein